MQTLEQGDKFENEHSSWIRSKLPIYELVWQKFIGHNQRGYPSIKLKGSEEIIKRHKHFYQSHYSFALAAYRLDSIASQADPINKGDDGEVDFLAEYERLFLVFAYVGHIHDMFEMMDTALKSKGSISSPFRDFYSKRSNILHGPRPPIKIDDTSVMIPKVSGRIDEQGEWSSKGTWDSVDTKNWTYLCDYIRDTVQELFPLIQSQHCEVQALASREFLEHIAVDQVEQPTNSICYSSSPPPHSGSLQPPSGSMNG